MLYNNNQIKLKIILIGDSGVGKTKLLERFLLDGYNSKTESTFGLSIYSYKTKLKEHPDKDILIEFHDTAGQDRFKDIHPSFYYCSHACILVFDCTRKNTYLNLEKWYKELRKYRKNIPCILLGNKIDHNMKEITKNKYGFPQKRDLKFFFVSAAQGINVVKSFKKAIHSGIDYVNNVPKDDILEDINKLL